MDEGVESAEKAVVAYGGVQMGQLGKCIMDFFIYSSSSYAWFHGNCNRNDPSI